MPGQRRLALTFGKKTKTIYEGRNMYAGSNTVPRPGNHLANRQVRFSYGHFVPLLGYPQPHGFSKLQPFSVGAGPSGKRRNTPHQKEKGNQAEALRSRGELSASFSFKLDSVSVKQHVNQNAEAEAFRSRMRHSRRPSSACQKNKRAIKPKLCVAEVSFQSPFKLVWKWYFNSSTEAPFWSIKSGV